MGDENVSTTGVVTPTSALDNLGSAQNTQDLLADIFGSSSIDMSSSSPTPGQNKSQNAVYDIMSLFGNTSISPNPTGSAAPGASTSLDLLSSMTSPASIQPTSQQPSAPASTPTAPSSQPPQRQQLQSYTAYEKNGLKITLTPKVNPAQQGMVQILAKFMALEQAGVRNVNFQAAVPKVGVSFCSIPPRCEADLLWISDPTITDARHVQWRCCSWIYRNTTDASDRPARSASATAVADLIHQGRNR